MPCYQVITSRVEFKIGNFDLLKKALPKAGWKIREVKGTGVLYASHEGLRKSIRIEFDGSRITSQEFSKEELIKVANSIKRSYSRVVIDELAKKKNWFVKQAGENRLLLQKY